MKEYLGKVNEICSELKLIQQSGKRLILIVDAKHFNKSNFFTMLILYKISLEIGVKFEKILLTSSPVEEDRGNIVFVACDDAMYSGHQFATFYAPISRVYKNSFRK